MDIGTLALLSWLLDGSSYVSRAAAPKGGQSPVEYRGNLCDRPYFPPSIYLTLEAKGLTQSFQRPEVVSGRSEIANESTQQNSERLELASGRPELAPEIFDLSMPESGLRLADLRKLLGGLS